MAKQQKIKPKPRVRSPRIQTQEWQFAKTIYDAIPDYCNVRFSSDGRKTPHYGHGKFYTVQVVMEGLRPAGKAFCDLPVGEMAFLCYEDESVDVSITYRDYCVDDFQQLLRLLRAVTKLAKSKGTGMIELATCAFDPIFPDHCFCEDGYALTVVTNFLLSKPTSFTEIASLCASHRLILGKPF